MLLTLKVLNDNADLNDWNELGGSKQIIRGADAVLNLQLFQSEKKIRYVPLSSATITAVFLNSDSTTVSKTATFPFADDRSIIQMTFSEADTALLISQNIIVNVLESPKLSIALLQLGLQMISPSQAGC